MAREVSGEKFQQILQELQAGSKYIQSAWKIFQEMGLLRANLEGQLQCRDWEEAAGSLVFPKFHKIYRCVINKIYNYVSMIM